MEETERHERQFNNSLNPQIHAVQEAKLVKTALGDTADKVCKVLISLDRSFGVDIPAMYAFRSVRKYITDLLCMLGNESRPIDRS